MGFCVGIARLRIRQVQIDIRAKVCERSFQEVRIIVVILAQELHYDVVAKDRGPQQFDPSELVHRYARCGANRKGILHLGCMCFEVAHVVQFLR